MSVRIATNSVVNLSRRPPQIGPLPLRYVVKDNICTKDEPTTCASRTLSNYTSPFDATVVELLLAAGLQLTGKTNMDEFGMGLASVNLYYGPVVNPLSRNEALVAGGSSGGSAAAVAEGAVDFALGTDTGGSVRLPASYCGIVGFKPTYGRVSRWGVIAYAQLLDTVGILARDVDTVEKAFGVLDKHDERDPTSLSNRFRTKKKRSKFVVGVPEEFSIGELLGDARHAWKQALRQFQHHGCEIRSVSVPSIKNLLAAYYTLVTAEAASNLARYDGVRYGSAELPRSTAIALLEHNRKAGFGPETQRRIILGNYTLSSESGNHYLRATNIRRKIVHELNAVFSQPNLLTGDTGARDGVDILVSPTAFSTPPTIKEYKKTTEANVLNGYINDVLTVPASLAGVPAISVPGKVGIHIMGQHGDDHGVVEAAKLLTG